MDTIESATPDLERQIRAATTALEDEEKESETRAANGPDAEQRERLELRSKASLTGFLRAALSGRQVDGAEAELRPPLESPMESRLSCGTFRGLKNSAPRPKRRARPALILTGFGLPCLPIQLHRALVSRCRRVDSGTYASATISTSLSAAAKAKGADADSTAAAFTVTSVTPKRISARLSIQIEDVAAVGQANFESILRENLALVLSDELDDQAINGDGSSNGLTGMFERLSDPAAPGAIADFDAYAAAHASGVDGMWAVGIEQVSIVCGAETYRHASRVFQSAANFKGEMSAAAYAKANSGGLSTNKRMPDSSGDGAAAILYRKGRSMLGGAGAMRTAVCPHWGMISIDDIFSGSASGTRNFTMHVFAWRRDFGSAGCLRANQFPVGLTG